MHFQLLPYERVGTLMDDLFDAPLSEGTLFGATKQASTAKLTELLTTAASPTNTQSIL